MTDLRVLLAYNMKQRRRALKITQSALAERAGVSTPYIALIETKSRFPSPEMMMKIAKGLEIDTADLFTKDLTFVKDMVKKYQKDVLALIRNSADSVLDRKLEQLNRKE